MKKSSSSKSSPAMSSRPKANPMRPAPMTSPRPKPAAPAREVRKNQMMLDSAARVGDGYAKGGMVSGKGCGAALSGKTFSGTY